MKRSSLSQRRRAKPIIDRQASEAWARGAQCKPCAICGALRGVQGHHVITQQQLRTTARTLGLEYDRLRWDERNRLPLCPRHHAAHHSRAHPIPWDVLVECCPKVVQFARELELLWWLERTYPGCEQEAA